MFKKSLIIVCEDKDKVFARGLVQLISMMDDKDSEIVGVKDGSLQQPFIL